MGVLEQLAKSLNGQGMAVPDDEDTRKAAPHFWELVTSSVTKDGNRYPPADLALSRVPGAWRVTIQVHALHVKTSFFLARLQDLAGAAEKHVNDPQAVWEEFRSYKLKEPITADRKKKR